MMGRASYRSDERLGANGDLRIEGPVFDIGTRSIPGARFIWCRGELDISSEERVVTEVAGSLGEPVSSIVLDLRDLTFADCTVIRCVEYAAAACERCQVSLYVDIGDCVRDLLDTLDPDSLGRARGYLSIP